MTESLNTTYESVLNDLKHETDLTKLCGSLYNLTQLYLDKSNWKNLEKYEQEYSKALSECQLLKQKPQREQTIKIGEKVDLNILKPVKKLDSGLKFDKHVLIFLRHLA